MRDIFDWLSQSSIRFYEKILKNIKKYIVFVFHVHLKCFCMIAITISTIMFRLCTVLFTHFNIHGFWRLLKRNKVQKKDQVLNSDGAATWAFSFAQSRHTVQTNLSNCNFPTRFQFNVFSSGGHSNCCTYQQSDPANSNLSRLYMIKMPAKIDEPSHGNNEICPTALSFTEILTNIQFFYVHNLWHCFNVIAWIKTSSGFYW